MYAILAGALVALITVVGIKYAKSEQKSWAYPLTLSLYPIFYFAFAVYGNDYHALFSELLYSMPIFIICIICAIKNLQFTGYLLASGYIGHGIYDLYHHFLFINSGVPVWWPQFCATVDILIGLYLFFFISKKTNKAMACDEST